MESLDSIVDELIWRIEGGFHNKWDGFAVAHTPRINQEVRDVLALVIDAVDMQNEDFEPAAGGIEEEKDHGDVPVVKGSAEYERRMKAYLEMQASAIPESALKKALRDFDARLATEGVPLGKMAVFLRRHGQDISPLDAKASTMHDGQARSPVQGGRDLSSGNVSRPFSPNPADTLLLAGRGGRSSLRGSPRGNKKRARIDYRVWEPQRHVRHYFPEIAMIQGNFVRGRITGSVLVRFHDGALYTGPWVDAQEPRSKHHWGSWKTPENRTYIGASVDHHLDVGNITGAMFEVRYPWGEIYQGPLLKGKRHGWGRCQYSNGGDYIGQWWYDRRHGFGRMVTMDNALGGLIKYEGPWRHDKEHGNGRCRFPDGSSFEGMYRHGLMHGQGIRHFANGNTYKGAYSQGSMCGYGVLKYADQRTYKGEFKDDKRHGHGELVYPERHTLGHSTVAGATKVLRRIAPVGSSSSPSIGSPSAQDGGLPMEPVTLDDIKTAVQALGADVESRPASRHVRFTENLRPGTVGSMFGKGSTRAEGVGGGGVNTLLNSRGRGGGKLSRIALLAR